MDFLVGNYLNTTTMISVDSGTLTFSNLFNPDKTKQWVSSGYNDDTATEILTISFSQTLTVDRIGIKEHNLKEFKIFYNGNTATTLPLASGDTTTISYTGCSETSQFFNITPTDCTSVSLYMTKTQTANSEKALGYLYVGESLLELPRIPSAKNYKIAKTTTRITHTLSDGGKRLQKISEKWNVQIKLNNLSDSSVKSLEDVYDRKAPLYFSALGTTTGWNGVLFETVWEGDFGFWEYSDNAVDAGHDGNIKLNECPC